MGHTHYWTRSDRVYGFEEFMAVAKECQKVCEATKVDIRMESDSAEPAIFTKDTIRFNGHNTEGAGTFLVKRVDAEPADECKTYERPYDKCVTACLVLLRDRLKFEISSDAKDTKKGLTGFEDAEKFVKEVLEKK
jgi:hypothetical protein